MLILGNDANANAYATKKSLIFETRQVRCKYIDVTEIGLT